MSLKVIVFLSLIRDIALFSESNSSHSIFKSLFQTIFLKSLFFFTEEKVRDFLFAISNFIFPLRQFSRLLSFVSMPGKFVKTVYYSNIKNQMDLISFHFYLVTTTVAPAPLPLSALRLHSASQPSRPYAPSSALLLLK